MNFSKKLSKLKRVGIFTTLRMNFHYFGWKGLIEMPILCSTRVKIQHLGGNVKISHPSRFCVRIGFGDVGIFDYRNKRTLFENTGTIIFNGKANIGFGSAISCAGQLTFGNNFVISAASTIIANEKITIGDDVLISWDCLIMDTDFHPIFFQSESENVKHSISKPIEVKNHVWIGCRTLVLKGSSISPDSVVGAGSTVSGKLKNPNSIYISNNPVKRHINWGSGK